MTVMLRYWRFRLRLAGLVHRDGSVGNEWRCRLAEWLHASYRHGSAVQEAKGER